MNPVKLVVGQKANLGEGPSWDDRHQVLYWVDINGQKLHTYNPATNENSTVDVGQRIGAVVPRRSGGVVMALQNGFYTYDFASQEMTFIGDPEADKPGNRFNDGKCDAAGRFWAGTMSLDESEPSGALYCLDTDLTIRKVLDNITVSNGIAWSADNTVMYYIDSNTKLVKAYDYDLSTGSMSNPRVVVDLTDSEVYPDGMASDEEGMIWVALWDGYCVKRWNPETGELLATVDVPAARSSSCVFGGADLEDLYITSARVGISEEKLAEQPLAGGLFTVKTNVRGVPTYAFGG